METNFFGEYDAQHGADLDPQPIQQNPVISFNLDKPMGLDDYSKLPEYAQKEYLTKLKRVYGAGAAQIGQLFGLSTEDACELMLERGVSAKGRRPANADERWTAFLGDRACAPLHSGRGRSRGGDAADRGGPGGPRARTGAEPPARSPEAEGGRHHDPGLHRGHLRPGGRSDPLTTFAALVGNLDVRITLSIDEGDAS